MAIGIGDLLRVERERAGVTIADAAHGTKMRESHLRALEAEDYAAIGGDVYVKGFLRTYATFLRLDPEPFIAEFARHRPRLPSYEQAATEPIDTSPEPRRPLPIILTVLAVLAVAGLALLGMLGDDDLEDAGEVAAPEPADGEPSAVPPPPPPEEEVDTRAAAEELDPTAPALPAEPDQPDGVGTAADATVRTVGPRVSDWVAARVTVSGPAMWMQVSVDGAQVAEGMFEGGTSAVYEGYNVELRVADAGNTIVEVNGVNLGALGATGQVADVACSTTVGVCTVDVGG